MAGVKPPFGGGRAEFLLFHWFCNIFCGFVNISFVILNDSSISQTQFDNKNSRIMNIVNIKFIFSNFLSLDNLMTVQSSIK